MATLKPTTVPAKRLAETISGASTTFKLNNIRSWAATATNLTSADFGSRLWAVFRNSSGTLMEIMEIDPTTITSASSPITIIARGLKFDGEDGTEVAANKLTWIKGDTVVELGTHVPQLLSKYADKVGDMTIEGLWTFNQTPLGLNAGGSNDASTTAMGIGRASTSPNRTIGTVTITIASPAVFTRTSHGLTVNDRVQFTTSGTLPTGLSLATTYYVISTGLTADDFRVSTSQGGTAVNTTVAGSGTHTIVKVTPVFVTDTDTRLPTANPTTLFAPIGTEGVPTGVLSPYAGSSAPSGWLLCDGTAVSRTTYASLFTVLSTTYGVGDGSTTFNLPDLRSRIPLGAGTGTKVATFSSRSGNVITVTGLTNANNNEFQTGQAVLYDTTSGAIGGLTDNTTYYIVRVTNTTFSLATTLANAQNGTVITLSSDGSGVQTFTQTLTARTRGDTGGEENHAMSSTELLAHFHVKGTDAGSGNVSSGGATSQGNTNSTGGNAAMNIMPPFVVVNYIIKT